MYRQDRPIRRDNIIEVGPRAIRLDDESLVRVYKAQGLIQTHPAAPRGVALPTRYAEDLIRELSGHVVMRDQVRLVPVRVLSALDFGPSLLRLNRLAERHKGFFERIDIDDDVTEMIVESGVVPIRLR